MSAEPKIPGPAVVKDAPPGGPAPPPTPATQLDSVRTEVWNFIVTMFKGGPDRNALPLQLTDEHKANIFAIFAPLEYALPHMPIVTTCVDRRWRRG